MPASVPVPAGFDAIQRLSESVERLGKAVGNSATEANKSATSLGALLSRLSLEKSSEPKTSLAVQPSLSVFGKNKKTPVRGANAPPPTFETPIASIKETTNTVKEKYQELESFRAGVNAVRAEAAKLSGVTGNSLNSIVGVAQTTAKTFGMDLSTVLQSTKNLSEEMGISFEEAGRKMQLAMVTKIPAVELSADTSQLDLAKQAQMALIEGTNQINTINQQVFEKADAGYTKMKESVMSVVTEGLNWIAPAADQAAQVIAGITPYVETANSVLAQMGPITDTVTGAIDIGKGIFGNFSTKILSGTRAFMGLNVTMAANPIGVVVIGILLLIALVTAVIVKWNSWGAALSLFMGPLGMIISLFMSFRRNWDLIKKAFQTEGILGGLKMIGKTILDAVLMPVQQLLELISKIPGIDLSDQVSQLENYRKGLGVVIEEKKQEKAEAPKTTVPIAAVNQNNPMLTVPSELKIPDMSALIGNQLGTAQDMKGIANSFEEGTTNIHDTNAAQTEALIERSEISKESIQRVVMEVNSSEDLSITQEGDDTIEISVTNTFD